MPSPRTLREWCRVTCASYPNVDMKDMSTSFRDGLAFCAIIHKHRPDLIDFSSLSKDNVYQNNKLAFQVAETKLGIPALLDPKEMVSTRVPDCLSIITYLSQYYDVFNRKSRAGPAGLRSSHATVLNSLTKCKTPDGLKPLKSSTHLETDRLSATRPRAVCSLCLKPVHLIQRHLIDGKVYHRSCFSTSPTRGNPNVKTNHPWMTIVHPGPWTQLPPAPAPVPTPRSKSVSRLRGSRYRPKVPPPNPFEEHVDEAVKSESTDQTKSSVEAGRSENACCLASLSGDSEVAVGSGDAETTAIGFDDQNAKPLDKPTPAKRPDYKEADGTTTPDPAEGVSAVPITVGTSSQIGSPLWDVNGGPSGSLPDVTEAAAGQHVAPDEEQSHFLPRSLSVPVISYVHSRGSSVPDGLTGINESVTSCQSKPACRENPFDRTPTMTKSKTLQVLPSRRAPAPGHGFPLIKRKVQTDQNLSTDELQTEMGELEKRLEVLQQRGVQLESNLRDCKNDRDEEQMLMEWFSLLHERQVLVRRDTELVYLTKQQKLEERQADVEYELRCLLNKPGL
ncbi:hypothetical protein F2P81_014704 [Scophthalmus maximus]|uniref:MICAL-like protein 1 n=1 Tax=Scophthalmus maximus TaxID=52904 RepID=A0A6A4SMU7_SCOMX|nr:hypothetical protein F2P81_014704 [Scophthalmus maximus]